jgi:hypothetical protein
MDGGDKKSHKKNNEMTLFILYFIAIFFMPALLHFLLIAPGI